MTIARAWLSGVAILIVTVVSLQAAEPVTLDNLVAPDPNSADEPFAKGKCHPQSSHV